ncbi:MAG: porphobilinogen synthase [Telluria sp.]|nr:porphobilinogen synthase [Telluria sp.]
MTTGSFPSTRLRRTRQSDWTRRLVAENQLTANDLIWPIFIRAEADSPDIKSMPGVRRLTLAELAAQVEPAAGLGIPMVALFPATPADLKDADGTEALNPDNLICQAAQLLKKEFPSVGLLGDVALDLYTTHGHDGLLRNGQIANDETLAILARQAVIQAHAGVDVIGPSDMMDGRVAAIRAALDKASRENTQIMSYSAKYASGFYGPYREAVQAADLVGDKKTYQMDASNANEALREVEMDLMEGADMVMVKPGMPYLDIIRNISQRFAVPTFAYQVSGEYAMITAAAQNGWLDRDRVVLESLLSFKRAGASGVLTYFALDAARMLKA